MESSSNQDDGIIDKSKNTFARKDWIEQRLAFTQHRYEQVEILLSKTVEEIHSFGPNDGSYPAFVAIRWRYAEIKENRLAPTYKWAEWQPPDLKRAHASKVAEGDPKGAHQTKRSSFTRRSISNSKRYDVMRRDNFQCVLCGASGREAKLEIDHINPVSRGGTDDLTNLRCLCFKCNRGKQAKTETMAGSDPS